MDIPKNPLRYLSPHADGLTPGPYQVLMPFTSLTALAFSLKIEDRRVSPLLRSLSLNRTLPAMTVRPHLTKLHRSLNATACGFGRHP